MGSHHSYFPDNDSLIDSIVKSTYVPPRVERVLRLVDRGHYATGSKQEVYSDTPWRSETLHMSSPRIYTTVLRELNIQPGQSVLNVGSGTGYLSTMFGLLIGSNGVNHGIELHSCNVEYARERLRHFTSTSDAIYECDFCPPQFTIGNIFSVVPPFPDFSDESENVLEQSIDEQEELSQLSSTNIGPPPPGWSTYDRIYVGAMTNNIWQLKAILRLLSVGGSLITPIYSDLHKFDRVSETAVTDTVLCSVGFADLVLPSSDEAEVTPLPKRQVERLEVLACRCLRQELRKGIIQRNGGQLPKLPHYAYRKRRQLRRSSPPPSQPPSPPSTAVAGAENAIPSTSRAPPLDSASTLFSAPLPHCSSSSSASSLTHHRLPLPTNLSPENSVGGEGDHDDDEDDSDELEGVRPFTSSLNLSRLSSPARPPSEAPQLRLTSVLVNPGAGILDDDTNGDSTTGSSNTTMTSEVMDLTDRISLEMRNGRTPSMNARNSNRPSRIKGRSSTQQRRGRFVLRGVDGDIIFYKGKEDSNENSVTSSFTYSTGSNTISHEDGDQASSTGEDEDGEDLGWILRGGDQQQESGSPRRRSPGHSSQRSGQNKRRKRDGIRKENRGCDSDSDESVSNTGRGRSNQPEWVDRRWVRRGKSYSFKEEMRSLLEEMRNVMGYGEYLIELVLGLNYTLS